MKTADSVNNERVLQTFLELVQIDSPSGQEEEIGRHLAGQLETLGCLVRQDDAGNLIAIRPGQGAETILLSSHMDTVGTDTGIKPVLRDGIVYSDGSTILGADDKSGVAAILETLTVLNEHPDLVAPTLEIIISVGEERGLQGAKQLDKSQLHAQWGIILDAGGPIGTLVYSAPSQTSIRATVYGRKAHAGSAPEKGINAIVVAADAISAMPLGRIDEETTSNIGVIQGGTATNIVPDEVYLRGEARSRDDLKLSRQVLAMTEAFEAAAARHDTTVDVELISAYHTYRITPEQRPYAVAADAIAALGFELTPIMSGGGTDGNIYTGAGIPCVVLSTGMTDVHTTAEHIAIQDLVDAARVLVTIVTQDHIRESDN